MLGHQMLPQVLVEAGLVEKEGLRHETVTETEIVIEIEIEMGVIGIEERESEAATIVIIHRHHGAATAEHELVIVTVTVTVSGTVKGQLGAAEAVEVITGRIETFCKFSIFLSKCSFFAMSTSLTRLIFDPMNIIAIPEHSRRIKD